MGSSVIQRAFSGGELAPALTGRADLAKYTTGLRTCRNFLIQRSGGVANRPGTRFVAACKTLSADVQLVRYVSEIAGQSILIEAGFHYLRFYQNGGAVNVTGVPAWDGATAYVIGDVVASGGTNYYALAASTGVAPPAAQWAALPGALLEIPTPFSGQFHWSQSGRTITITSYEAPPYELIYQGVASWVFRAVTPAPALGPPQGLALTPGAAGTRRFGYVVTSAKIGTFEQSEPSAQVINALCAAPTAAAPNALAWTADPLAAQYYVYCDPYGNGTYGYIGTATGAATFNDIGFTPDFQQTPPLPQTNVFADPLDYPLHSATYQQRRCFANTPRQPDGVIGSRIGFPSNFGVSSPLQDDDAIAFTIAGNQHNPVRSLVGLRALLVLTDAGEWAVTGVNGVLSPSTIDANQGAYVGANDVAPVIVGNAIVYVQARGSIVRDLQVGQDVVGQALVGRDLTIFAGHLFDGHQILHVDYQQVPHSIVWCVRDDGTLLGLTYVPDQDEWGWSRHDTDGGFVDVCVVPEASEDVVYVIVVRTIGGVATPYIERLAPRTILDYNVDSYFVDAGLSYSGTPVAVVAGLTHLEGKIVAVLADGAVIFDGDPASPNAATFTVHAGAITLPAAASVIHVGLPIAFADVETLDLDVQGTAVRDTKKRIGSVSILIDGASSRTWQAGPDSAHLTTFTPEATESLTGAPAAGQQELRIPSRFAKDGRVFIRQKGPLPLTILGIIPNVEPGG